MAMSFFDAAADLVPLGFKVLPLASMTKLPVLKEWQRIASDDLEQITQWASERPNANIGIATGDASGVDVIDLDVKDGRNGIDTLNALARQGKVLPPSPIALTPTGGRHLYFRRTPGLKNVAGVTAAGRGLGVGIDVRAAGGFVVAPPSVVPHGAYRWLIPPMTPDFPRLPQWAVTMLNPPPRPKPALAPEVVNGDVAPLVRFVASSTKGRRNECLFWAACRVGEMVSRGQVSAQSAGHQILDAALAAGLPAYEARRTINSGFDESGLRFEG
jgi:hypothetical protein